MSGAGFALLATINVQQLMQPIGAITNAEAVIDPTTVTCTTVHFLLLRGVVYY